jgi:hypothetical protein
LKSALDKRNRARSISREIEANFNEVNLVCE